MVVARLCSLTVIAFDDSCAAGTVEAKLPETTLEPAQSGLDGALFGQNPRTRHMESRMSPQTDLLYASRSEEHTSELQSLMRISYAVFSLKQKNHKKINS